MLGRAVVSAAAIISIMVLALPITIVGSNFSREYEIYLEKIKAMKKELKHKKKALKKALRKKSAGGDFNILAAFKRRSMDTAGGPTNQDEAEQLAESSNSLIPFSDENRYTELDHLEDQDNPQLASDASKHVPRLVFPSSSAPAAASDTGRQLSPMSTAHSVNSKRPMSARDAFASLRNHAMVNLSMKNIFGAKEAFDVGELEEEDEDDYNDQDDDDGRKVTARMLEITSSELPSISRKELEAMFLTMRHAYCKIRAGLKDEIKRSQQLIEIEDDES
jgi:hypothetical protein